MNEFYISLFVNDKLKSLNRRKREGHLVGGLKSGSAVWDRELPRETCLACKSAATHRRSNIRRVLSRDKDNEHLIARRAINFNRFQF